MRTLEAVNNILDTKENQKALSVCTTWRVTVEVRLKKNRQSEIEQVFETSGTTKDVSLETEQCKSEVMISIFKAGKIFQDVLQVKKYRGRAEVTP